MEKRKKNKLELIILISIVAVIAIVVTIVATIKFGKKEPYDTIIRVYDPYTNELLAEVTSEEGDKTILLEKTITTKRSDPKALGVRFLYVDSNGKEKDLEEEIRLEPEKHKYGVTYKYLGTEDSIAAAGYYTSENPITSSGMHRISAYYWKTDEQTPHRQFESVEIFVRFNVIEIE